MTKLFVIAVCIYIVGAAICIAGNWLADTLLESIVKSMMR